MSTFLSNFNFNKQENEAKNTLAHHSINSDTKADYQNLVTSDIDNDHEEEIELLQSLLFDIVNPDNADEILIKAFDEVGSYFKNSHFEYNLNFLNQEVHNKIDEILDSGNSLLILHAIKMLQYFSYSMCNNQNIPFELIDQCFHVSHISLLLESDHFPNNDILIQYLLTIYSKDEQTLINSSGYSFNLFPIARTTDDIDTKITFIEFFYSFCIKCKVSSDFPDVIELFGCLAVFLDWDVLRMRTLQIAYYLFKHIPSEVPDFMETTEMYQIIINSYENSDINTILYSLYLTDLLIESNILSTSQIVDIFRYLIRPMHSHTQSICENAFKVAEHALYGGIVIKEIIDTGIVDSIDDVLSLENQYSGSSKIAAGKTVAAILYNIQKEDSDLLPMEEFHDIVEEMHEGNFISDEIYDVIVTKFAL